MAYKHGAYGERTASQAKSAKQAAINAVYVGTAPVNLIRGYDEAGIINTPVALKNLSDAVGKIGNSANWDKYTLAEVVDYHFNNVNGNVGPIYVINVLDPDVHRKSSSTSQTLSFANGYATLQSDTIILDTFAIADKTEGTDYELSYDFTAGTLTVKAITELSGSVACTFYEVDLEAVTKATIIGQKTQAGEFSGIKAVDLLYMRENAVPNILAAPGWSDFPEVYQALCSEAQHINGHWDAFVNADIPVEARNTKECPVSGHKATITDGDLIEGDIKVTSGTTVGIEGADYSKAYSNGTLTVTLLSGGNLYDATKVTVDYRTAVDTITKAINWKATNGYTSGISKVAWPMAKYGTKKYHLSTVMTATMLSVDLSHDSIPFESCSNKSIQATEQYFGAASKNAGFDQNDGNDLNAKGITTLVFWDGTFVLWGPHTAAYQYNGSQDVAYNFESNVRMLMFITNGFQLRHGTKIDGPLSPADKDSIVVNEQGELDALVGRGALIGSPECLFLETENSLSDMLNGDFTWHINATVTPPLKSALARVTYTDEGFAAFFGEEG